ncbi:MULTISPECIES: tripartite tricarboxylate transporter substrate binding protein [unclassified Variovorax]|uniref:Bug family tripartite tricarboxylate transporter substrate binding protein n=1 Tax=unclassified Variovorax TaxID=663243 RepID=UPI001BD22B58|nr:MULTISPECIES: tripartite tricarboxylate transporter substrate binding protein [unclassified Variovorax]
MTQPGFSWRQSLQALLVVAAAGLAPLVANAAGPLDCRAVHLVAPNPPGGATDVLSRIIGDPLSRRLGVPVIVDNKGGASTSIGNEFVAHSAPDGCTLLMGNISMALNKSLMKLNYEVERDLRAVIQVAAVPLALFVNPKVDVKTVPELVAYAKAHPAEVNFSSAGPGTPTHLVVEMLNEREGTKIVHVPYRGAGPATMDVIGGLIMSSSDSLIVVLPHIRSGALRALAVSGPRRSMLMPEVPTFAEAGIGFADISLWYGVMAPSKAPDAVVQYLNKEIAEVLRQPDTMRRLQDLGSDLPPDGTPQQFQTLLHNETARLGDLIRKANITLD